MECLKDKKEKDGEDVEVIEVLINLEELDEEVRKNLIEYHKVLLEHRKHQNKMKKFAGFILAYLILLLISIMVIIFIPFLSHYAEIFLFISNFVSIGLSIWSIYRIFKMKIYKEQVGIVIIIGGLVAIVMCSFSIIAKIYLYLL